MQEEEIQQKEQEFKEQVEEERKKTDPKRKKYTRIESTRLFHMLEKIEKEIGLDNNLQDAKNELQTIRDKLTPHFSTIDYCYYLIKEEESSGDKSKELDEHQLEEKLENLIKQIEQKKSIRSQYIEKEKELTEEIDELLKSAELLVEELKKEKFR
ncbi:2815_t:CDS:2 [Ambispora leptoticha]|uniref:2815_t:CDS:1 n=1 Tax=Ambispora leptoticha TaxID=144679 RepID=A0A9N9CI46_9GLOM|nr:2815_t:CDS:2 [Ambispora leptoticha]